MMSDAVEFTYKKIYLITRTMDFPLASEVSKMESITLVTPDWVTKCIQEQRIVPKEPYSPDPRHILRDVAISVTGLSAGDTTAVYAAAWALGAQFSDRVIVYTTHLIATSDTLERCKHILENGYDIKIVLPNWISDCMKLRRKVDDTPYCFPNPSILSLNSAERMKDEQDEQMFKYTHSKHGSGAPPKRLDSYNNIFDGRKVCLGNDVDLDMLEQDVRDLTMAMGAGMIVDQVDDADVFIGKYRKGPGYLVASQKGLIVGNITWLYYMAFHNAWSSPLDHLLHYPIPADPLPGMEDKVISVTNYVGEARSYLEELITALGAHYVGQLSAEDNTHLICAYPEGEKYKAAKVWNIDIVSHLWLEETFALWAKQPISNRKYSYLPEKINLQHIIGMTKLIPERLKEFYEGKDVKDTPAKIKAGTPPLDVKTPVTKKKLNTYGKRSSTRRPISAGLFREAHSKVEESAEKEPPKSAPSSAKEANGSPKERGSTMNVTEVEPKADSGGAEKEEQEGKANGEAEIMEEGEEDEEATRDLSPKNDEAPKRSKKQTTPKTVKKQKTSFASSSQTIRGELRIILAGLDDSEIRKISIKRTKLAKLGIVMVEDPEKATCIIATRRRTSEKFLRALSIAEYVIHPDYLFSSLEQDTRIEPIPEEYWVSRQDEELQQCIGTRKKKFANKSSKLFKGYQFNMAVGNLFSQLDRVVQAHGALPSQKIIAKNPKTYAVSQNDNVIVLAIEDEKEKTAEMRRNLRKKTEENGQSLYVYDRGWLTDAIIKMSVQFDDNQLQIT